MSKAARRLGRGIRTLISPTDPNSQVPESVANAPASSDVDTHKSADSATSHEVSEKVYSSPITIDVTSILPNPHQPRSTILPDSVSNLAVSIKTNGLLQPITVRPVDDNRFEIIAGERRWSAIKSLGWEQVPVIIRQASDQEMLELALIENIHREDLNAIERARAYREFRDQFNLNAESVAQRLGEDRTTVTNYLRLLDLPDTIQSMVAQGQLSMGHARCLLGVADAEHRQQLAESVINNQLSVRALEEIVRREKTRSQDQSTASETTPPPASPHLEDVQRRFEESLKTKVRIKESNKKGTGRITIDYFSLDDFDRIAGKLGVSLDT